MAFPDPAMDQLLVDLTWNAISKSTGGNGLFKQIFFDESVIAEICSATNILFAPGLLEAVRAPEPPTVDFFQNLPTDARGLWGVYALVLEQPGCEVLIYIGSGTDAEGGIPRRWRHYDKPDAYRYMLPEYVRRALDAGYKITHKGLLVWTPIPRAAYVPRLRLLFVATEVAFSFLFWTMNSKDKDFNIGFCCPWPREAFSYSGLCSHSALGEAINGNFNLSAEQLTTMAADAKQRHHEWRVKFEKKLKARDPEAYYAARNEATRKWYNQPSGHGKATKMRQEHKRHASKKYYCQVCEVAFTKPFHQNKHNLTLRHLKKVREAAAGVVKRFRCEICEHSMSYPADLRKHNKTQRHLDKVAKAKAASA